MRISKNSPCLHGCAHDSGEKRNVLIVSVLLPIGVDLTLRSNTDRAVKVLRVRQLAVLLHVGQC